MSDAVPELRRHPVHGYWYYEPPSDEVLREHYERRYFQSNDIYSAGYTEQEIAFFRASADRKVALLRAAGAVPGPGFRALELGVGDGWSLDALVRAGADAQGIDYSAHAIGRWNPSLAARFTAAPPLPELAARVAGGARYDLVWIDNVLEHVPRPAEALALLAGAIAPGGLLLVEVPNDQSALQAFLLGEGQVAAPFWLAYPEHLSYFTLDTLDSLVRASGFERLDAVADFPIDWFLFNDASNYVQDRAVGKRAHQARLRFERYLTGQDEARVLEFYRGLARAGLGRNITALFRRT